MKKYSLWAAALTFLSSNLFALTTTWNVDASGDWGTAGNWNMGVPGAADTAVLGAIITVPTSVTMNAAYEITNLGISNVNSYLILDLGGGSLTFSNQIEVVTGNHTIAVPLRQPGALPVQALQVDSGMLTIADYRTTNVSISGNGDLLFDGNIGNIIGAATINNTPTTLQKTNGALAFTGSIVLTGDAGLTAPATYNNQFGSSVTIQMTDPGCSIDFTTTDQSFSSLDFQAGIFTNGGSISLNSTGTALTMRDRTLPGTVNLTGASGGNIVFDNTNDGTATISGALDLGFSSFRTFTINEGLGDPDMSISGTITGSSSIIKDGAGTLEFSGGGANTFIGDTIVTAGILNLAKTAGTDAIGGSLFVQGGTTNLSNANQIPNAFFISLSGGTFDMNSNAEEVERLTFTGGTLINNGGLTLNSTSTALTMRDTTLPGAVNLTGAFGGGVTFQNTNNGTATIQGALDLGTVTRTFTIDEGGGDPDMNVTGTITGTGGLTKVGAGTLQFFGSGANTYSGDTTLSAGILNLAKDPGTNAVAGNLIISGGTALLVNANQIANTGSITLSSGAFNMNSNAEEVTSLTFTGGTLSNNGGLTLNSTSTALTMRNTAIPGSVTLSGGSGGDVVFDSTNNGTATINSIDVGAVNRVFNIADGAATSDMTIGSSSGSGGFTKTGAGTLTLSGASSHAGSNSILSAGTLDVNGSLSAATLTTSSGSILKGTGTVNANVSLGGR